MNVSGRGRFANKVLFGLVLAALFMARGITVQATDPPPESVASDEAIMKEPIKGTNHDRPNTLLRSMAAQLHAEAYSEFIHANGNGFNREIRMMPTKKDRKWYIPVWNSEELAKAQPPVKGIKDLALIHGLSLDRFAASNVQKNNEKLPPGEVVRSKKKQYQWEIKALDLVGLVMHETPVVYMSETLPEMKDLKKKATRSLDVFESEGLEELASGKDLYVRSKNDTIRVLGPIHAGKACLKCHAGTKEGEILGAFSYTLRPAEYRLASRRFGNPNGQQFDQYEKLERLLEGNGGAPNTPTPKK